MKDYVCGSERNDPAPTVFKLRALTFGEYAEILALREQGRSTEGVVMAAERGLTGWSNLVDDFGQPVSFTPDFLDILPYQVVDELGEEIMRISSVDEQTKDALVGMTRFSEFLSESKTPEIWDCDWCAKHGKQRERKCPDGYTADSQAHLNAEEREEEQKAEARAKRYGLSSAVIKKKTETTPSRGVVLSYRGYSFTECPVGRKDLRTESLFGQVARADYFKVLPRPGGIDDQENQFIQAVDIVRGERNKIERLRQAEEEGKRKKRSAKPGSSAPRSRGKRPKPSFSGRKLRK